MSSGVLLGWRKTLSSLPRRKATAILREMEAILRLSATLWRQLEHYQKIVRDSEKEIEDIGRRFASLLDKKALAETALRAGPEKVLKWSEQLAALGDDIDNARLTTRHLREHRDLIIDVDPDKLVPNLRKLQAVRADLERRIARFEKLIKDREGVLQKTKKILAEVERLKREMGIQNP